MPPEREYPRVLVVNGSAFGEHSSTAVTLTNLFRGWPGDRLALVHSDTAATNPGQGFCRRIWQSSLADVPIDRTVRKLLGKRKDQVVGRACVGMPAGLGARGAEEAAPLRTRLHDVASAWADLLPTRPAQAFWAWVGEFQPQVIYSMLGSTRIMGLVLRAAKHCGAPIVPAHHGRLAGDALPGLVKGDSSRSHAGAPAVSLAEVACRHEHWPGHGR